VKNPVTWAQEFSEVVDSPCHVLELALQVTPLPGQLAVLPGPASQVSQPKARICWRISTKLGRSTALPYGAGGGVFVTE
jgi:hypothetical protein